MIYTDGIIVVDIAVTPCKHAGPYSWGSLRWNRGNVSDYQIRLKQKRQADIQMDDSIRKYSDEHINALLHVGKWSSQHGRGWIEWYW